MEVEQDTVASSEVASHHSRSYFERHEDGSPLPFLDIPDSAGLVGAAVTGVKNHRLALQIITSEATNMVRSSAKIVARTPAKNGLITIVVILLV
jgi:hypothetical protein